jgi:glycosyltransferase involved in cell wall biosynthesis
MKLEIIGKFYDNHSLTIINRNIALGLSKVFDVYITPLDKFSNDAQLKKDDLRNLKELQDKTVDDNNIDIQIRHSYPPVWRWPVNPKTKIVFIQPWEWMKIPFEWQYRWENFADALIVPSKWEATNVVNSGLNPDRIHVVPNGFDSSIFNLDPAEPLENINPNEMNFVYVGCPQWRKGLDILLNAWAESFKSADKVKLIIKDTPQIYGQNNVLNEITKLQYKRKTAPILYIDKNLSDTEMARLYKNASVLVHPYRAEGFGMPVQEALACGCVPMVSAGGPTDEFVGDVAIKFSMMQRTIDITNQEVFALKPGDSTTMMSTHGTVLEPSTESVSQTMTDFYLNHKKDDILQKARNFKLENTWENVILKYQSALEKISANSDVRRIN